MSRGTNGIKNQISLLQDAQHSPDDMVLRVHCWIFLGFLGLFSSARRHDGRFLLPLYCPVTESAAVSPAGLLEEALACFQAALKLVVASATQVRQEGGTVVSRADDVILAARGNPSFASAGQSCFGRLLGRLQNCPEKFCCAIGA
jgi:hypothetical protein